MYKRCAARAAPEALGLVADRGLPETRAVPPTTPPPYPPDFAWGVATAPHQIEGGLNGPGEPRNNWAAWEDSGRVERSAAGCGFWDRYPEDVARAEALGLSAFRLGLEWARVEPRPGVIDHAALGRYADILAALRRSGMEPVVTLQHFTHPAWLGTDPWLDPAVPARFAAYAATAAVELGRHLAERHGQGPVRTWVTVNEPNSLCLATYLLRAFPRGRRVGGGRALSRALAGILMAHVQGRRAIHDAYDAAGWPAPVVTYNAWACASYAVDRYLVDLLRPETRHHPRELGRGWRRAVGPLGVVGGILDRVLRFSVKPAAFAPLVAELGKDEDPLDVLAFDYYGPYLGDYLGWSGIKKHPWEWPARPDRMAQFTRAYVGDHPGKSLVVLEHGLGTLPEPRGRRGRHRPDGLGRDEALTAAIHALDSCIADGVPLAGYFHWSLIDNYEWGTYAPRFGLHGVDRGNDLARLTTDITGVDAAATYRALIAARRAPAV